jgi:ATP-dependent DNA helicase RecG
MRKNEKEKMSDSMLRFENQDIEFKQGYVPDIKKEVTAFINADGGTILIGVRKDGAVIGVKNPDKVMQQTANSLKDSIVPDVMPFVSIRTEVMENRNVVVIEITTGTNRPYYLKDKGLRAGGVYVRKGSSAQPMTDEGIREMILASSGNSFEEARSLNQSLSFDTFASEMKRRNLKFGRAQMRTLKLIGEDGLYTNLALLLSDQCPFTIKVALFQGVDKAVFRDRREFKGSVLKQLEDVYQYIDLNNKTNATFSGLERHDARDYPEDAVREVLLNCIVHRDYSFSGSTLINIFDDRMEYVSLGGLVAGLELESIFLGASVSRNPNLAAVFYRMQLIESYGTGISKIRRLYADRTSKPKFETAKGVFRVTLLNCNYENIPSGKTVNDNIVSGNFYTVNAAAGPEVPLRDPKQTIIKYAKQHGQITRKQTEELLSVGSTKAYHLLTELCNEKKLIPEGNGRNRVYRFR